MNITENIRGYFDRNPSVDVFFFTAKDEGTAGDQHAFYNEETATQHVKNQVDKTVTKITRADVEAWKPGDGMEEARLKHAGNPLELAVLDANTRSLKAQEGLGAANTELREATAFRDEPANAAGSLKAGATKRYNNAVKAQAAAETEYNDALAANEAAVNAAVAANAI